MIQTTTAWLRQVYRAYDSLIGANLYYLQQVERLIALVEQGATAEALRLAAQLRTEVPKTTAQLYQARGQVHAWHAMLPPKDAPADPVLRELDAQLQAAPSPADDTPHKPH